MYFKKTGRYHHKKTVYMISHIMYVGLIMTVGTHTYGTTKIPLQEKMQLKQ